MRSLVGDNRPIVLLGTRAGKRYDAAHGDELRRDLVLDVLVAIDVLGELCLCGDDLAAVEDRAAAHGQDEVDAFLASKPSDCSHERRRLLPEELQQQLDAVAGAQVADRSGEDDHADRAHGYMASTCTDNLRCGPSAIRRIPCRYAAR